MVALLTFPVTWKLDVTLVATCKIFYANDENLDLFGLYTWLLKAALSSCNTAFNCARRECDSADESEHQFKTMSGVLHTEET